MARLDHMSSNREVAQLAATLGREFDYELLAAVVTVNEETLQAELAKLVSAGILYVKGHPPACTYAFKHRAARGSVARCDRGAEAAGDFIKRSPR